MDYGRLSTELPVFSGDLRKYKMFRDTFLSLVPESNYSPLKKFTLLKSKLRDVALQAVEPLEVEAGNYEQAWRILDELFDNERKLIETSLEQLTRLPTMINRHAHSVLKFTQSYRGHNKKFG